MYITYVNHDSVIKQICQLKGNAYLINETLLFSWHIQNFDGKIFSLGDLPGEKLVILLILSSLGKTVNKSSLPRAKVCSVTTAYYSKTKIVHSIEKQQQQKKHFFQEC